MSRYENLITSSNEIFNKAAEMHGNSSQAVLWGDQKTQYMRFHELIKYIDLNNNKQSLLDVGCGNGELYKFLNFNGYRGNYTGYDINQKLLALAKSRFPNIDVHCNDILHSDFVASPSFDYVLMSGVFNANIGQTMTWVHEFIQAMFSLCSQGIIFNAISTHVTFKDKELFYIAPEDLLTFCIRHLSPRVTIAHHNLPYNYTVCVRKDSRWHSATETLSLSD